MHDDDELMKALRTKVLDDDVPVSSLLRVCLMLGKRVGATSLATWAKLELDGYPDVSGLPKYRRLAAPMHAHIHFGPKSFTQQITKLHVPERLWEYVPDDVNLRQSIDVVEQIAAGTESYKFTTQGMLLAASGWTHDLGEGSFHVVEEIYYSAGPAQIRVLLVP